MIFIAPSVLASGLQTLQRVLWLGARAQTRLEWRLATPHALLILICSPMA